MSAIIPEFSEVLSASETTYGEALKAYEAASLSDPVALLQALIRADTVNPPGNESLLCDLLEEPLRQCGFKVLRSPLSEGRDNLIAYPSHEFTSLMCFTGHLDTVPIGNAAWSHSPFSGAIHEDRVYGRGSSDMKGGIAAFLSAVSRYSKQRKQTPNVLIILTAGEETGCEGARSLSHLQALALPVKSMIVGEPTANELVIGHKGALWLSAEVDGITAHGSMPELGDNAIYHAANAICKLQHYAVLPSTDLLLGKSTLNVGTIHGGLNVNSVPDYAEFEVDIRIVGKSDQPLIEEVQKYLGDRIRLRTKVDAPSLATDPDDSWVKSVSDVIHDVTGVLKAPKTVSFFSDGPVLQEIFGQVPTIVLGPGEPSMAHKVDEYCEIEKLKASAEIYFRLIEVC